VPLWPAEEAARGGEAERSLKSHGGTGKPEETAMARRWDLIHGLVRALSGQRTPHGGGAASCDSEPRFDFDALARDLAQGLSRREALRRLGLAAAAAVLGSLGLKPAAGQTTSPTKSCSDADLAACLHNRVRPCDAAATRCEQTAQQLFDQGMARCSTLPNPVQRAACVQRVTETRDRLLEGCAGLAAQCRQIELRCRDQFGCPNGQSCCNNQCSLCPCDRTLCEGSQRTDCCEAGAICLAGLCINVQTDPSNCGSVGNACPANSTCVNGQCVCDAGYSPCIGPFGTGPMVCCSDATEVCRNGICLSGAETCPTGTNFCGGAQGQSCCDATQPTCCDGVCCPSGQFCCGNRCSVCPCDETFCTGSQGTSCCRDGRSCCDGACVDLRSDENNCGDCGNTCGANAICENGRCRCPDHYFPCGGGCCHESNACLNGTCSGCPDGGQACGDRCCPDGAICSSIFSDGVGSCRCLTGYTACGTGPGGSGPDACCNPTQFCRNGICLLGAEMPS
jgi:hypothetical protein